MNAPVLAAAGTDASADSALPTDWHYARNLVDGVWRFPAAPYEFEIRNPLDSTITTVVPLSSRFDVQRAVAAAAAASPGWAADADRRRELMRRLAVVLARMHPELARLQAIETGLAPADSQAAAAAVARLAGLLAERPTSGRGGVSAHILSWGLPLLEAVGAMVPPLAAGHTVVVKPSLRAPLSAVAFAHLATTVGFPPGVVNVVQGTGEDVGAALCGTRGLALLHVRGGERTIAQATRASSVTGVPLRVLRGGGNVTVAGPDADPAAASAALAAALRVHSTGGPLGMPILAVHADAAGPVVDALVAASHDLRPAPLPTETLRRRATAAIDAMRARGAVIRCGGTVPDDVRHRMGWVLPPTVVVDDHIGGPEAPGPILTVRTWRTPGELAGMFDRARSADGVASVLGLDGAGLAEGRLPHPVVLRDCDLSTALAEGALPGGWFAEVPE